MINSLYFTQYFFPISLLMSLFHVFLSKADLFLALCLAILCVLNSQTFLPNLLFFPSLLSCLCLPVPGVSLRYQLAIRSGRSLEAS